MYFFYFLLGLFVLLLLITLFVTLINFSIKVVTQTKYNEHLLIVPSFLTSILWIVIFYVMFIFLSREFNINILNNLFDGILAKTLNNDEVVKIVLCFATFSFVGIFIQAFLFLTVNINYNKFKVKFKNNIKNQDDYNIEDDQNKEPNQEQNKQLDIVPHKKLTYSNAIISSLFLFSLTFFIILILLSLGNVIAKKLI